MSKLLGHIDGRECFKSALLRLTPNELKACRLVSWEWNRFILDELWGNAGGREKLRKKDEEEENARNLLRDQAAQVSLEAVYCRM